MADLSEPVFICMNCGCGFLRLPENSLHDGPLWATVDGPMSKDTCWGSIEAIPRWYAIRRARPTFNVEIFDAPQED